MTRRRIDCYDDFDESLLYEKPCYAALDLSMGADTTALGLVFPTDPQHEIFHLLVKYWLPAETIRERKHLAPFDHWVREGWIEATEGNQTDFAVVESGIREAAKLYDIRELRYDPWNAIPVTQRLADEAFELVEFRQSIANYAGPTRLFERLVMKHCWRHNGNPVFTWQLGHAVVVTDSNQNMRPVKPNKNDHRTIDGVQVAIMALSGATANTAELTGNYYEENDVELI